MTCIFAPLHVDRGQTLHIVVSPDAMIGDCAAGKPLSQADADFITGSIFPGAFAGVRYDAARCKMIPAVVPDGGAD